MKTEQLKEILTWLRGTDLVEVSYKRGDDGFSLAAHDEAPMPHYPIPASRYIPVLSPTIGLFQWGALGKSRKAEEGAEVAEGDALGIVETSKGNSAVVKAPCPGRVAKIFIEGGHPAEYGQVLLFLEPR